MHKAGWLFLVVGGAALAWLFVTLRPAPPPAASAPDVPAAAATSPATLSASAPRVVELQVKDGRLLSGPGLIKAMQGDEVVLRVTSDRADDLHLHGYDLALHLQPGVAGELRFVATRSGRFEYELHQAHAEIGVLEVHPH